MKALFLILALLMCLHLARVKAREARNLMTHPAQPELLVGPDQHVAGKTGPVYS